MCPVCHGRSLGRVGVNLYYCWDCCVEVAQSSKGYCVYEIELDGTRTAAQPGRNAQTADAKA